MKITNYLLTTALALNLLQANAQCGATGSHYVASYPSGWNYTDLGDGAATPSGACGDNKNGSFYANGNAAYFFSARPGRELRLTKSIPAVNNLTWTMDFTLQITTNNGVLASNSPAVVLASLTADPISILTSSCTGGNLCTPCGYSSSNTDAIWVELVSDAPSTCNESQAGKNWRIIAHARNANGTPTSSTPIPIPSGPNGTYYVRLQRSADHSGMVSVYSNSNYQTHLSGSPQCLEIPLNVNGLDALSHEVISSESCQRVFNGVVSNLKIDNSVPCAMQLNPSFTIISPTSYTTPFSYCGVQPITVLGSSSSILPITGHLWVVEECYANGNQFGPVWYSNPVNGAPTVNYTINPALFSQSVHMQEGHYYKISLVLQNCGNPWSVASQVIQIKPVPVINMAGSSTVAAPGTGNMQIQIGVTGGTAPFTASINGVPLTGTTSPFLRQTYQDFPFTYEIAVSNSEGCTATKNWHIAGPVPGDDDEEPKLNPVFTVTPVILNADEFSLEMYPEYLDGYGKDEFNYAHIVEELDESGEPYYSNTNTDCWRNYPDIENLKGFVSTGTGTGTYTQAAEPNCGDPGRFLIGHTYRVTTLMSAKDEEEVQHSVIVYYEKSGQIVAEEDKNAPDMRHQFVETSPEISISPNPSTGVFTIELAEGNTNAVIEVYNQLGARVQSFDQKTTRAKMNLTGLPKGTYLVKVLSGGTLTTKKFVLE